uniref:Phosphoglycolate phosphatase n=1 Tax=uncultured bacterium fosmid pJB89E1 TaxID=1478073 RepID=A0A0H3UAS2_9BACT|nr:hypothetical protein [uncultured bacterium fosmid pJB89E1]
MYKHFIFDIDGTLIDTEMTLVRSLQKTVKDLMDKDMSHEEAYYYFGVPSIKVGGLLGYQDERHFLEYWENEFMNHMHLMQVFEGAESILAAAKAAGCKIGCVTSRNRLEFERDPFLQPMLHYFDIAICAEDTTLHKPNPEPMLEYMRRAAEATGEPVDASECLFLGDTEHDYRCGHGAGCAFALADWRNRGLQGIPADHRFTNASEAIALLSE